MTTALSPVCVSSFPAKLREAGLLQSEGEYFTFETLWSGMQGPSAAKRAKAAIGKAQWLKLQTFDKSEILFYKLLPTGLAAAAVGVLTAMGVPLSDWLMITGVLSAMTAHSWNLAQRVENVYRLGHLARLAFTAQLSPLPTETLLELRASCQAEEGSRNLIEAELQRRGVEVSSSLGQALEKLEGDNIPARLDGPTL
jgi:hypothetical protein